MHSLSCKHLNMHNGGKKKKNCEHKERIYVPGFASLVPSKLDEAAQFATLWFPEGYVRRHAGCFTTFLLEVEMRCSLAATMTQSSAPLELGILPGEAHQDSN